MLERIMKRAHELARKFEGDYQAKLSLALKMAWKEEKEEEKMVVEKSELKREIMLKVNEIIKEKNNEENKFNHTYTAKHWQKYGKERLYINRSNGRNEKSKGYIDLENIDFSNLDLPAGKMYNEVKKMEEKIETMDIK